MEDRFSNKIEFDADKIPHEPPVGDIPMGRKLPSSTFNVNAEKSYTPTNEPQKVKAHDFRGPNVHVLTRSMAQREPNNSPAQKDQNGNDPPREGSKQSPSILAVVTVVDNWRPVVTPDGENVAFPPKDMKILWAVVRRSRGLAEAEDVPHVSMNDRIINLVATADAREARFLGGADCEELVQLAGTMIPSINVTEDLSTSDPRMWTADAHAARVKELGKLEKWNVLGPPEPFEDVVKRSRESGETYTWCPMKVLTGIKNYERSPEEHVL